MSDSSQCVGPSFDEVSYAMSTSDGDNGRKPVEWRVMVRPDGHRIVREVYRDGTLWPFLGQDPTLQDVIWPTWPGGIAEEATLMAVSESPLGEVRDYWTRSGDRLRDSAKWMATVLGAALAAVVGTSPLTEIRGRQFHPTAVALSLSGILLLGITLLLVLQVLRPQFVSFTDVLNAPCTRRWPVEDPLFKLRQLVEAEKPFYLPAGIHSLADLRHALVIEEITMTALTIARARTLDPERGTELGAAQAARAAKLIEIRTAAAKIATIGEYFKLRERSTWTAYLGVLLGLMGTIAIMAAFTWPTA